MTHGVVRPVCLQNRKNDMSYRKHERKNGNIPIGAVRPVYQADKKRDLRASQG